MKSAHLILSSLLAAVAIAQPRQHRHRHAAEHERRDQAVVWITDYATVIETVPVTTTIWVTPGQEPAESTSSASVAPSPSEATGQFFETATPQAMSPPATSVVPYVVPTPSSKSTVVAPSSSGAAPVPTTIEAPSYAAPVESSKAAPPVTSTPQPATPQAPPATAAPVPASTASPSPSSSGACSSGSPCSGDITWYDVGLGACGWTNDASEAVVALPHGLMGTQSNGNPYCGRYITVEYAGKAVVAKVVDKCMGCEGYAIDLSSSAFSGLASLGVGRTEATWHFND